MFDGKSILITGGTGSFGRHCVGELLKRYQPKRVIIYSRDEFKQYEMQQIYNSSPMRYFIGDVRDAERLGMAMRSVDYVIHAAALKQVPAAEYNPMEFVKTNINGAENVYKVAMANDVEKVVALSTDKAANPINLYGATKLVSDKVFVAANNLVGERKTRFSVVRYGNVVGSRGSVVPLFRKLASQGATELPLTDAQMTRFWITLQQGVDFVIKSFYRMQGGEIFVPKIPSARITDLAEAVASGIVCKEVGIRPGEKMHELMCPAEDSYRTYDFSDHFVIAPGITFNTPVRYDRNLLGETGCLVPTGFEYNSETNTHFLTVEEMRELCNDC